MKKFLNSRDVASKGAALLIALAMVVLVAGLALAYFSRTTTDRQLAQSSYNDTSADLLARTALDIEVNDFKQEILSHPTVTPAAPFYITPVPYGTPANGQSPIPNLIRRSFSGDPTGRTSTVNSGTASANGRFISLARWNSHYLIPRAAPGPGQNWDTVYTDPISSFTAPDWVLVTPQGPNSAPPPSAVIGRYAFAVYDEGGLLDMTMAGYPNWTNTSTCATTPSPTPWLVNVGRKGIVAFADLAALASPSPTTTPNTGNIVGWRNYATTGRTPPASFGSFSFAAETDCAGRKNQDNYGSYLLYFGDPPFTIESVFDKLTASLYPFTAVATELDASNTRTDQLPMTRQQLLKLQRSLDNPGGQFSQNLLQYMGTFSRERNWPAPDWPNLNGSLSEGRFNLNNLALVIPNPNSCAGLHGKKVGWTKGKNRNHICGTTPEIIELFGLTWVAHADDKTPGYWKYIDHTGPQPNGSPDPDPHSIICRWGANQQEDFFEILHYALNVMRPGGGTRCPGVGTQPRTFGIAASLIDQYDTGGVDFPGQTCYQQQYGANPPRQLDGCDLDAGVSGPQYATHTTVIKYGQGASGNAFAFGMEMDYDPATGDGDVRYNQSDNSHPHRPCGSKGGDCIPQEPTPPAVPTPVPGGSNQTQVINHAFSNVGELGYGIDTSTAGLPTMDFSSPNFYDAPVLDFFCYNPISSAYPRAGIVNLYTRNAPVLAAILSQTLQTDAAAKVNPPSPVLSQAQAMTAANAIVTETQHVLAGSPAYGSVKQTDMTRAIAARLAAAGGSALGWSYTTQREQLESIARALAEVGQTRTWNLLIDVIAQTGKYKPNSDLSGSNFVVEGEKRYWLHISLGRDLIQADGLPCGAAAGAPCQVDVLGTQLEEVIE